MDIVTRVKLLAKKDALYSLYVFKNLEDNSIFMCTKLPNWILPFIEIGDIGFVKTNQVKAGELYYDPSDDSYKPYKYSNIYMTNYIIETDISNSNIML
jgi:hypothetical protein